MPPGNPGRPPLVRCGCTRSRPAGLGGTGGPPCSRAVQRWGKLSPATGQRGGGLRTALTGDSAHSRRRLAATGKAGAVIRRCSVVEPCNAGANCRPPRDNVVVVFAPRSPATRHTHGIPATSPRTRAPGCCPHATRSPEPTNRFGEWLPSRPRRPKAVRRVVVQAMVFRQPHRELGRRGAVLTQPDHRSQRTASANGYPITANALAQCARRDGALGVLTVQSGGRSPGAPAARLSAVVAENPPAGWRPDHGQRLGAMRSTRRCSRCADGAIRWAITWRSGATSRPDVSML